ncbi:hypothetical protein [Streptomyces parvulus]|uniref:hypothetical protein n=1 Tax=Streptomyces parvulus TaxID=146923 RepID=UPI0011C0681C|nr:hypothetical protein [Streptomyces parvulus]
MPRRGSRRRGWGVCATQADEMGCLRRKGVVGWSREYLPFSHLDATQWAGTSVLAGMILLAAAVLVYAARRALR